MPYPSKSLAELTKPVPVYDKAPCWMQKAWSADNSRKATAKTGTVTVYAPPCVVDKKPAPVKPSPETS